MKLLEIFNKVGDIEIIQQDPLKVYYRFNVGNQEFTAIFYNNNLPKDQFYFVFKDEDDDISLTGMGGKSTFAIFGTLYEIFKRFVKQYNPNAIIFTADPNEPSRIKLYDRFAQRFQKLGWDVKREKRNRDIYYTLRRNIE